MNYATTNFDDVLFSFGFPIGDIFEGAGNSEAILAKDENGFYVSSVKNISRPDNMKEKGRMKGIDTVADAIALVDLVREERLALMGVEGRIDTSEDEPVIVIE